MRRIKLDNFDLVELNLNEKEHIDFIYKLQSNEQVKKYLGDLLYNFKIIENRKEDNSKNCIYVAYYNDYIIGYIAITFKNNRYELSSGLLPEFRGESLGVMLLQEYTDYLLDEEHLKEIYLDINSENVPSMRAASKAGYEKVEGSIYRRNH